MYTPWGNTYHLILVVNKRNDPLCIGWGAAVESYLFNTQAYDLCGTLMMQMNNVILNWLLFSGGRNIRMLRWFSIIQICIRLVWIVIFSHSEIPFRFLTFFFYLSLFARFAKAYNFLIWWFFARCREWISIKLSVLCIGFCTFEHFGVKISHTAWDDSKIKVRTFGLALQMMNWNCFVIISTIDFMFTFPYTPV